MSDQFYSRATGRLSKSTHGSFTEIKKSKRDGSSIYSIEDDGDDSSQYPTGSLSQTQVKYIQEFVRSLAGDDDIEIDPSIKGIHWIGIWYANNDNVTISCSFKQPDITNCTITVRGASSRLAQLYAKQFFIDPDIGHPSIKPTATSYQVLGKYSIPFTDSMVQHGHLKSHNVDQNYVIIGQTQPVFTVISSTGAHECTLTYNSCLILDEVSSDDVNVTHPTSETLNFTFRSLTVADRDGEGGHMTVHGSGIIQLQCHPRYIKETMTCFKECILSAMRPQYSFKFINSLNVVRRIDPDTLDDTE